MYSLPDEKMPSFIPFLFIQVVVVEVVVVGPRPLIVSPYTSIIAIQ